MPSLAELVTSNAAKDDIKDVPPLPIGTYLALVVGPHTMVKSRERQTDGVEFNYRLLQALDDVDQDGLTAHLEARGGSLYDINGKHTIWDSPFAATALRDFVYDALGVDESLPMKQALGEAPGRNFSLHIRHRPFDSGGGIMRMRAEIDKTFKAE